VSHEEIKDDSVVEPIGRPFFASMIFNPKVIIGVLLMYAGLGIPFLLRTQSDILLILKDQSPTILGVVSAFIGLSLALGEMTKLKRLRREERFIDVDEKRGGSDSKFQAHILSEIRTIKSQSENLSTEKVEDLVSKFVEKKSIDNTDMFDSFENYFNEIRGVLIEQAHTADKKASILLDKGTAYSKGGITFFITSIVAWQILSWLTEFKEQYIYGIVSCSLLFIFIEFLAAWFLKQYRHFVDTSTYHIKVKSIFDKYMMSYLAIKSLGGSSSDEEQKYQAMLKILEEDIKWPESYQLKNGDVSFAKEALETMTHFAKAMKSEVKNQAK
jgi:hypothetical protein